MEEKARRGRISVWANPPRPPISAFILAIISIKCVLFAFSISKERGAIFCHVDRMKAADHEVLDITEGNQLWKGEAPSFIIIAAKNEMKKETAEKIGPIIKIKEANAWIKKYFIALRIDSGFEDKIIMGINTIVLISRAIHM